MKLEDLPDDFTPAQFMKLDRASLDAVPYTLKFWKCQAKHCKNGTKVREYGISPFYFLHRNSKYAKLHPSEYWENLSIHYWLCGKHWKFQRRLEKRFDHAVVQAKILDLRKMPLEKLRDFPTFGNTSIANAAPAHKND